jgi:diguanylate cyclase (GGDEF)-like protein
MQAVLQAAASLPGLLDQREVAEEALRFFQDMTGASGIALFLIHDDPDTLARTVLRGAGLRSEKARLLPFSGLKERLSTGEPLVVTELARGSGAEAIGRKELVELGVSWCMPLRARERMLGMVCFKEADLQEELLEPLRNLASVVASVLDSSRRYEGAMFDEDSGLFSARVFQQRMREELRRAMRHGNDLSLLLLGWRMAGTAGDPLASAAWRRRLGEELRALIRADLDIPARYGESEIALVLPDTGIAGARVLAERILIALDSSRSPTSLIGIAAYPDHGDTVEELTESAETALMMAGEAGRERVQVMPGRPGSDVDYQAMRRVE